MAGGVGVAERLSDGILASIGGRVALQFRQRSLSLDVCIARRKIKFHTLYSIALEGLCCPTNMLARGLHRIQNTYPVWSEAYSA